MSWFGFGGKKEEPQESSSYDFTAGATSGFEEGMGGGGGGGGGFEMGGGGGGGMGKCRVLVGVWGWGGWMADGFGPGLMEGRRRIR